MKSALGHGSFPKEAGAQARPPAHFVGQRQPGGERQRAAHTGLAAKEAAGAVKQVHGAAPPA